MKKIILYIYVLCASAVTLSAQGVKPRIAALGDDAHYMELLRRDSIFSTKTDSLSAITAAKRQEFIDGGSNSDSLRQIFVNLEQQLFDLRNNHSDVANEISLIEQEWIIKGMGSVVAEEQPKVEVEAEVPNVDVNKISKSAAAIKALNDSDIAALESAEESETKAEELMKKHRDVYANMQRLEQLYKQCKEQKEGATYVTLFESLKRTSDTITKDMERVWGEIYDNKTLIYNILLESEGHEDVLLKGEQLTSSASSAAADASVGSASRSIVRYDHQKRAIVEFEMLIAERLELKNMQDSLRGVSERLASIEPLKQLPEVKIKLRNFIAFENISYTSPSIYTASKPIPLAKVYEQGRYYRIQLGAYKEQQSPSVFKGGKPLCYDKTFGFWTYYLGCFASYNEAEAARKSLLEKGFQRPEVVVWSDGKRQNIAREPLPKSNGYRVAIKKRGGLDDVSTSRITKLKGKAEMSRISSQEYVVSPLDNILQAEDIVAALTFDNNEIQAKIIKIE